MLNMAIDAFVKVPPQDDIDYGTGYDMSSVMHYDSLVTKNLEIKFIVLRKNVR